MKNIAKKKVIEHFLGFYINEKKKLPLPFFQAAVVSILLYGCTTWTLTNRIKKKLDGNDTRMPWAILNESWKQHPTKQQLYGHLFPLRKLSKLDEPDIRGTAGEVGTSS